MEPRLCTLTRKVLRHRLVRPMARRYRSANDLAEAQQIAQVTVWLMSEKAAQHPSPVAYLAGYVRAALVSELVSRQKLTDNITTKQYLAGSQFADPADPAHIPAPVPSALDRDPFDNIADPALRDKARTHLYRRQGRKPMPAQLVTQIQESYREPL